MEWNLGVSRWSVSLFPPRRDTLWEDTDSADLHIENRNKKTAMQIPFGCLSLIAVYHSH